MRRITIRCLICLFSTATLASSAPAKKPAGPTTPDISVMAFNIRFGTAQDGDNAWPHRRDLVAETILRREPDLLGLQESVAFQVEFLAERLPGYEVYSVGRTPAPGAESCALFFRKNRFEKMGQGTFWLSETPEVAASKSWDSSLPRIVSWVRLRETSSDLVILFANTHFDHIGPEARLESARLVRTRLAEIADGAPVVLTGDFNCGEGSEPYLALTEGEGALLDTHREQSPASDPAAESTFTGFGLQPGAARIDWILCSPNWGIVSAEIDRHRGKDGRYPSDHEPVHATLRLKPSK